MLKTLSSIFAIFALNMLKRGEIKVSDSSESVLSEAEKKLLDLTLGKVEPKNEDEKQIVADNKKIIKRGGMIDIPHN